MVEGESQPLIVAGGGGSGAICESGGNTSDAPGMDGVTTENGTSDRKVSSEEPMAVMVQTKEQEKDGIPFKAIQMVIATSPVGGFGGGGAQSGPIVVAVAVGILAVEHVLMELVYNASGGGGGGSYNRNNQSNGAGANNGDGYIVISIPN